MNKQLIRGVLQIMTKSPQLNEESQITSNTEKLRMKEKASYGLGAFALNLLISTAGSFAMYFYTEIAGIAVAVVGTLLLVARVLDGVSDIAMGVVVDKTKSKYGKARPWLLWMAIPFGLSIILLFVSPEIGGTGKTIYALLTYTFATAIIYTATAVPHATMLSTMTQDQVERGHLSIFKTAFAAIGGLSIGALTLPVVSFFGDGKQGWLLMGVTYGVLATILLLITFKNTKERSIEVSVQNKKTNKIPLKESISALFKNKYWFIILIVAFLIAVQNGIKGSEVYYAEYLLGNPKLVGVMMAASSIPLIVMLIILGPLMKRFTKRNLSIVGFLLTALGALIMLIDPGSIIIVVIGKAISGGALPMAAVSIGAMIADTVEYGEWKTGVRNEGLLFASESMGMKIGLGIGGALSGWILGLGGFVSGQATQTPGVITAIKFINIHAVYIICIVAIILLLFYKLDEEYPRIIEDLKERRNS